MMDFKGIKEFVIKELGRTNTIEIIEDCKYKKLGYKEEDICIHVLTEFINSSGVFEPISFHLVFPKFFPLVLPKVILPPDELLKYKFLPHVEDSGVVCTFDSEMTKTDIREPVGIAKECLRRAKLIIEEGLSGKNHNDYEEEFKSYWLKKDSKNDKVRLDLLCLTDNINNNNLKLLKLNKESAFFKYVLHNNEEHSLSFMSYLDNSGVKYSEIPVFYVGQIEYSFKPPFSLKNRDVLKLIEKLPLDVQFSFRKFINQYDEPKTIIATIIASGKPNIIAWTHNTLDSSKEINGFRKKSVSNFRLLTILKQNDYNSRFLPTVFSPIQKQLRTSGILTKKSFIFLIVGIGSIGSNLIHFLNSFQNVTFKLVDFDFLKIENLGRHFLGYDYVPYNKAIGMKSYLQGKNPFQKIDVKTKSIMDVYIDDNNYFNNSDYIFLTTANINIEEYIVNLMEVGKIVKPIFLIWVEPYLSGGHCLYLHPNGGNYQNFFTQDNYFKYNIIDNSEYRSDNPLFSIKEAGCQTSFTPYSQSSVISFLTSIFAYVKKIINDQDSTSHAISWVGNLDHLKANNIAINSIYCDTDYEKTFINNGK